MSNRVILVGICMLFLILDGCNGGGAISPAGNGVGQVAIQGPAGFPTIGDCAVLLDSTRQASFTDGDVFRLGSEYDTGLPSALVTVNGDLLQFSPDWNDGAGLEGAAYAIYTFVAADYDREPKVLCEWNTKPPLAGVYIGLSDWGRDEWNWFDYPADGVVEVPALDPYFNGSGELLLAVVNLKSAASSVRSVRLGDPPVEWIHSWGGAQGDIFEDTAVDADGNVYCAGVTGSFGAAKAMALLVKFNGDGGFEWCRTWDGEQNDSYTALAVGDDGNIYLCGKTYSYPAATVYSNGIIQCWHPDGTLGWSKVWGYSDIDEFYDIVVEGDALFVVGNTETSETRGADFAIIKSDLAGNLLEARWVGADDTELLLSVAAAEITRGELTLYAVGKSQVAFDEFSTVLFEFDSDLAIQSQYEWQGASFNISPSNVLVGNAPDYKVWIVVHTGLGTGSYLGGILEYSAAETLLAKHWGNSTDYYFRLFDLCPLDSGALYTAGYATAPGENFGATFCKISPAGTMQLASTFWSPDHFIYLTSLEPATNGRVVACGYSTADGAAGSWSERSYNSSTISGDWHPTAMETALLSTVAVNAPGIVGEVVTGVMDSGAGLDDGMVILKSVQ